MTIAQSFLKTGEISAVMSSFGGFLLYAKGLDANNTAKTQRSLDNGITWADVATYNSDQTAVVIAETNSNAQHRIICVTKQSFNVNAAAIRIKMTKETSSAALLNVA